MISIHNILSIARYERKTLFRSWFFRIFSGLALLVLFIVNFIFLSEAGMSRWVFSALPTSIPYFNLLILNVAQAIIAVFLASDFLKRDKKLDTTEVVYMRPMTNAEYVIGKTWGNVEVFILLNILILVMALVFNLLAPGATVQLASYAVYLLLISIPTLIFIVGLSFLLMSVIQNQAVTFVIILGYIGITLFVLQEKFYYLFDYMAFKIPLLQSDVIGFGNLTEILIHRGIYLSLGIACVFLTIYLLKRLPQSEFMTWLSMALGILFIVIGAALAYMYVGNFKGDEKLRREMISLNDQYYQDYFPEVIAHDIELNHTGNHLEMSSAMVLQNNSDESVSELVLHLNPGLEVGDIMIDGQESNFERNRHLIIIDQTGTLEPGEQLTLQMNYEGTINEAACYLDIAREEREEAFGDLILNADKRYAFVTGEYVLLTPEINWYPMPGVSFTLSHVGWYQKDFTDFTLHVSTGENLTAISQGAVTTQGAGQFMFVPEVPLTQISLVIGAYEKRTFTSDNVDFSLWHFQGHDYFANVLTEINDTIQNLVAGNLDGLLREYDLTYDFNRIGIVEVPAQFKSYDRIWRSFTEYMQPEQVFVPEKAYMISDADFRFMIKQQQRRGRDRESLTDRDYQIRVVNNFLNNFRSEELRPNFGIRIAGATPMVSETASPYFIFPQLYNFVNNVKSVDWPVMNRVFENYIRNQGGTDMRSMFMRNVSGSSEEETAILALQNKAFVELLTDEASKDIIDDLISLKSQVFFSMLQAHVGEEELTDFLKNLLTDYKFKTLTFEEFESLTRDRFNFEMTTFAENWFNERELPEYLISNLDAVQVISEGQMKTMVQLKVSNLADVDGIIILSFRLSSGGGMPGGRFGGGGGGFGGFGGGSNVDEQLDKLLFLEANQNKEFSFLLPAEPRMATINTLTSKNIPQTLSVNFSDIEENTRIIAWEGERISDTRVSLVGPDEIIVDNEDPGFHITVLNNSNLLRKLIVNEEEEDVKYAGVNMYRPPATWTATTSSEFYGHVVRSAYYIKSGDGSQVATWTTPIEEPGTYDLYYYAYDAPNMRGRGRDWNRGGGNDTYQFTIQHAEGEDEQLLNVGDIESGWVLLGSYYFGTGGAEVRLSNQSGENIVYADAIRLVKL